MIFLRNAAITFIVFILICPQRADALIGPIRPLKNRQVMFVSCEEIKMVNEEVDLYHHPLGIWMVEYRAVLKNMRDQALFHRVGFPAGFDVQMIEGQEYCDRFEQFNVFVNNTQITNINKMIPCTNYVETTGVQWSADNGTGIGYLNVWDLNFDPNEEIKIKITFNFIVKKPPSIYDSSNQESWYIDLMKWVRQDYEARAENEFQLPLNIGSFWSFYPDYIVIRTYLSDDWFGVVDKSSRAYDDRLIKRYEYSEPVGLYSPPEFYLEPPSEDELKDMTKEELIILRNSFFAKYGREFDVPWLKEYFNSQPWYAENAGYDNWLLSSWDIETMRTIHAIEKKRNNQN